MATIWRKLQGKRKKSKGDDQTVAFSRLDDSPAEMEGHASTSSRAPTRNLPRRGSTGATGVRKERTGLGLKFASSSNFRSPRPQATIESPALSRASSLSSTDLDYLNAQAYRESRDNSPKPSRPQLPPRPTSSNLPRAPAPQVDWEAFEGAFAPQARVQQPTRYPVPPLTEQQLNDLAGAFAPPARRLEPVMPPPKKRWGFW